MIPKVIHYCWLSNDPYPEKTANCINSWKEYLPDYKLIRWDKSSFDINSVQWVREAYKAKKYAFASDYIRFFALYNYGGIYLDTDVEVVKSFDSLLRNRSFIGFEFVSIPEAAVIGAESGLPWVKECLDYYRNKSFYDRHGREKTVAVPIMIKTVLKNLYGKPV
jgi:mannosyltransferase OCH1-like enzyme